MQDEFRPIVLVNFLVQEGFQVHPHHFRNLTSTLLFRVRADSSFASTSGLCFPYPLISIRFWATPLVLRYSTTLCARLRESSRLYSSLPTSSVCPLSSAFQSDFSSRILASLSSSGKETGSSTYLSNSK